MSYPRPGLYAVRRPPGSGLSNGAGLRLRFKTKGGFKQFSHLLVGMFGGHASFRSRTLRLFPAQVTGFVVFYWAHTRHVTFYPCIFLLFENNDVPIRILNFFPSAIIIYHQV